MKTNHFKQIGLFLILFVLIFWVSCKTTYNKYLRESCYECRNHRSKLYTINNLDTFYYNNKYYGNFYLDGTLVYERDDAVIYRKEILNGLKNGFFVQYYSSGNIKVEGSYLKNYRNGIFINYYDSTNIFVKSIQFFKNDSIIKEYSTEKINCNLFMK